MSVVPQEGELVVRRIPFDFPDDLDPIWNPAHHEWSQMGNGTSLAMPYLEPFLIATMREAAGEIDDPEVLEEIAGFCAQEGQHFRTHRRYNEWLKSNGYPELARVEAAEITLESLREAGLIDRSVRQVKVIKSGEIDRAVTLRGVGVTAGARAAIEAAGGSVAD